MAKNKGRQEAAEETRELDAEAREKKPKPKEYIGIAVRLYPDVSGSGERIKRDIRLKDTNEKFEVTMPFPGDDAECQALYNVSLEQLARHGLRQLSYDTDTDAYNVISEQIAAGVGATDLASKVQSELETAFFTERARKATGGAKAIVKATKEAEASTGMTLEQMVAYIKASKGE